MKKFYSFLSNSVSSFARFFNVGSSSTLSTLGHPVYTGYTRLIKYQHDQHFVGSFSPRCSPSVSVWYESKEENERGVAENSWSVKGATAESSKVNQRGQRNWPPQFRVSSRRENEISRDKHPPDASSSGNTHFALLLTPRPTSFACNRTSVNYSSHLVQAKGTGKEQGARFDSLSGV